MNIFVSSVSPHIKDRINTTVIMRDVIIALCPAVLAGTAIFGMRALLVVLVCVLFAMLSEWGFEKISRKPNTLGDLSAVVTGILLGCNLPPSIPLWQAALGSIIAIVVVKQLFGGIGQNFANPAITARIIMLVAFSGSMTTWSFPDAVSSATPLGILSGVGSGELPSLTNMFLGIRGGCIGETCTAALLAGGLYLLVRKVITWHTPVTFIATVFLLTALLGQQPVYQVMSGGLLIGAFFMATDYATTPSTPWGKIIFGFGCGLITVVIRVWGSYPEGVSFSILLMNILTPYITKWTRTKPLGGVK